MQTVNITNGEIHISDADVIVQHETNSQIIQFIVNNASKINQVEELTFQLLYYRTPSDNGTQNLEKTISNNVLYLNWSPDSQFTNKNGNVDIQIFGKKADSSVRWSTKPTKVYLKEDIQHDKVITLSPDFISHYLANNEV